jgi:hypothetical protein
MAFAEQCRRHFLQPIEERFVLEFTSQGRAICSKARDSTRLMRSHLRRRAIRSGRMVDAALGKGRSADDQPHAVTQRPAEIKSW